MSGQLGCPDTYQAVIHWRGGGQVFTVPALQSITALSWGRKLSGVSEASVTIARPELSPECCEQLGQVEPWCHELSIYRDGDLVWQGPIVTVEYGETIVVTANDVVAWLERLVNYKYLNYSGWDATRVAEDIIRWNMSSSALSVPKDYAHMLDYIVREDCGSKPNFKRGQQIAYVLDLIQDLNDYGFQYTTVGRALYLRDIKTTTAAAQARLTEHDFAGPLSVTRDGTGAVTHAFATNQKQAEETGLFVGSVYVSPTLGTPYGRLDTMVALSDDNATTAQLRNATATAKGGRYPAPLTIDVPSGSTLVPTAPVTVEQLVCGERLDIVLANYCRPVEQGFRLTEVKGGWSGTGETIQITCTPLTINADPEA